MLSVKPWRPLLVIWFLVAQAVCILLGAVAIGLLQKLGVHGFKDTGDFGYIVLATISFQGATCVLMAVFFHMHDISLGEGLGLSKKNVISSLLLAFGVTVAVL